MAHCCLYTSRGRVGADILNWGRDGDFKEADPINVTLVPGRKYRHSCVPIMRTHHQDGLL